VEPLTHALTSLALARTAQKKLPRYGTALLLVSGLAPDLDYASYFASPFAFLRLHRSVLHSLAGGSLTALLVAAGFYFFDRLRDRRQASANGRLQLSFASAFVFCGIGIAAHILLDVASGIGVQLLWPFRGAWYEWDLAASLDPWIWVLLLAGLLLPQLFRLVNEEIGERKKRTGAVGAAIALILLAGYLGFRADFHGRAVDLLLSREYHRRAALAAGAFPSATNPFDWRGVVITDATAELLDVPLGLNANFDPDSALTMYKPQESPPLAAGQSTPGARFFLSYTAFPFAEINHREADTRFELRDLRFSSSDTSPENIFYRVELNSALQVRSTEFVFASSAEP
jgi:membrane-bound metal-dependent hydrolase YbcI (DUF457 family)